MKHYDCQSSSASKKTAEIKKQCRHRELEQIFGTIRKQMLNSKQLRESQNQIYEHCATIERLIKQLQNGVDEAMHRLWSYCLSSAYVYLTESQIQSITAKLIKMRAQGDGGVEELTMGVWLVANWSSSIKVLKLNHFDLVEILVCLLCQERQFKLNVFVLYSLLNLCGFREIRDLLMEMNILGQLYKIYNSSLKQHIGVVSIFLKNILNSLPEQYQYDEPTLSYLLFFLKEMLPKCYEDRYLRLDCIYFLKKMFLINNNQCRQIIMTEMSSKIQLLVFQLEKKISYAARAGIYDIFIMIYLENNIEATIFMKKQFMENLWKITQSLLVNQEDELDILNEKKDYDQFTVKVWGFLNIFFRFDFIGKQKALLWLSKHCGSESCYTWDLKALTLLAKFQPFQRLLPLIDLKLRQCQLMDEPTLSMLNCILNYLQDQTKQPLDSLRYDELFLTIIDLQYDERLQISESAQNIIELWKQKQNLQAHPESITPLKNCNMESKVDVIEKKSSFWKNRSKIKGKIFRVKDE